MAIVKTPVSSLQEILAQQRLPAPLYSEDTSDNASFPFKYTVKIGPITAQGYAHTKKLAKHNCAQEALSKLGIKSQTPIAPITNNIKINQTAVNYVGVLNEHASGHQVAYPHYTECLPENGQFIIECQFMGLKTVGKGLNKKQTKQEAAKLMLERVKTEKIVYEKYSDKFNDLLDDDLMERVLFKYNSLQLKDEKPLITETEFKLPQIKKEIFTMEQLLSELKKIGHTCTVEVFQRNPYIIVLKVDKNSSTIMGLGDTKESAMEDLKERASNMFQRGFSFGNPLRM